MDILLKKPSECAFHSNAKDVCSGTKGIAAMKALIDNMGNENYTNDKSILESAKKMLHCESESCVINKPEFYNLYTGNLDELKKNNFKPEGPRNTDEWLSNYNLDDVLEQWQKKYSDFRHIPFQMRDFEKTKTELATIDFIEEYKKGTKSFGVIINTDISTGSGIHWFAIFVDFRDSKKMSIEYFNSSGSLPVKEIHDWLYNTKMKMAAHGYDVDVVIVSRIEHQKSNTECGVFSLWYIYSRLNNVPYAYFNKNDAVTDDMMYKFREHLFRQ